MGRALEGSDSLAMPSWGAWILGIAAVVTALGVIWKQLIFPAARVISRAESTLPVLEQIAREFSKNGGSTLKDQIDRIEDKLNKNGHDTRRAQETAERAEDTIMQHLQVRRGRGQTPT